MLKRVLLLALNVLLVFSVASAVAARVSEAAQAIDVVVVYPESPEQHMVRIIQWQRNWGETEMGPFLDANFEHVSQIYQQSGIDVEFNVVHHQQVDFSSTDPEDWQATLSLALMNSELGNSNYTPYLEVIEEIRDLYAGDIVIYWRDLNDGGPNSNGAGSIGGGEDEAYVQLTYGGVNPTIASHELGHLLGGQHSDGVQASGTFSIDGDTATLREYRTVMTVAVPLGLGTHYYVWRFSVDGTSVTGDIDCSQFSGKLANCTFDPTASLGDASHDAASVLAAMVPVVAGFRGTTAAVPTTSIPIQALLAMLIAGAGLAAFTRRRT